MYAARRDEYTDWMSIALPIEGRVVIVPRVGR